MSESISLLAVRPKTKSPPPIRLPPPSRSNYIAPITIPKSKITVNIPSSTNPRDIQGNLLPYTPNPYQPFGAGSSNLPPLSVVVPKVSQSYLPRVVPSVQARSPPRSFPQSQLRNVTSSSVILPTKVPISTPSIMAGKMPPVGEEKQIVMPITEIVPSSRGLLSYTKAVDVGSYAIANMPLPLEQSQRPNIIATSSLHIPITPVPSVPYSLREVLSTSPASSALRVDPVLPSYARSPSRRLAGISSVIPDRSLA